MGLCLPRILEGKFDFFILKFKYRFSDFRLLSLSLWPNKQIHLLHWLILVSFLLSPSPLFL